eukprot:Gregarina_sp_Pseudo_9__5275@NODE_605_length_2500_cov_26_380333_g571_i0_p3_GENE_NODE_605_length_2500_cov_26_380333_g571_i0NODE_605_length_2500_cov_26_380333_g571_i0_p3_ORF_typecomplete_len179_score36_83Prefoldin/PF02996_17/6_3e03Prefoldin/PF02996_17/1_2e23Prefoldin_2/PF01920_20/4_6e03Prefoldin_2/PF01920_20/0_00011OEP/PF02321_18/0_0045OEP/PF02321_18/2e03Serine_rich/PF08824_10/0_09Serine_rich/PF08824_10/1_8e02MAD/PF05557_13/0_026KASH_CCD/PF14662_6/0_5KASH_CCD/PF14662_6/38YabA/PF06156_13/11YabA/PF06
MDRLIEKNEGSARKIPKAKFFEDISEVLDNKVENAEPVAKAYRELLGKYQLMTASLIEQHQQMKLRLQSLEEAKETVDAAKKRLESGDSSAEVLFKASDCLYARAQVTDPSKIMLWLGSNTLMEYSPEEATAVLTKNIGATERNIEEMARDIRYLREQITVVEVANTRLHNWFVSHKA